MADECEKSNAHPTVTGQDAYPDFAFLVHSQTSLMQDLPPKVDTAMTARQKRRRTSPEDHTILEAAYQENSKPDKSERIEIVKRVTLSEKEVQIWFQNRRQNDRRKSRPLLPHEMVPHFRNRVPQVLLGSIVPENMGPTESHHAPWPAGKIPRSTGVDEQPQCSSSRASSIHDLLNPPASVESHTTASSGLLRIEQGDLQAGQPPPSVSGQATPEGRVRTEGANDVARPQGSKPSTGRVKRSHEEMFGEITNAKDATLPPVPSLCSHSSYVRLSMSLDGAVKVKTNGEETPSPPKQRAPAPASPLKSVDDIRKDQSTIIVDGGFSHRSARRLKAKAVRGQFGRSRDARTWEFYCDGDAREALSAHAENESTGSAVGAITLIRSQSQIARVQTMTERSGTGTAKNPPLSQRVVQPKLVRAKSSIGRLQDTDRSLSKSSAREGKPSTERSPSGDSDKENWAPGTRSSHHSLRRHHTSANRNAVLGDENCGLSHSRNASSRADGMDRGSIVKRPATSDKEIVDQSGRCKTLIEAGRKGEDLDCIQGLLSLSQGAWQ